MKISEFRFHVTFSLVDKDFASTTTLKFTMLTLIVDNDFAPTTTKL